MSHRFLHINSAFYESESDVIYLDFSACRVGNKAQLYGFSEPVQIPINIWSVNQTFTFSVILDASTASISESTTFKPSIVKIDFPEYLEIGDRINVKLLGRYLLSNSGFLISDDNKDEYLKRIFENLNFVNEISGFTASLNESSIIISAPDKTGVYYNGFTIQLIINDNIQSFTFSGGSTTYDLSLGSSKYYLTV